MRVALQLYTVRDQVAAQWQRALRRVAEAGYGAVEFAGHPFMNMGAMELKGFLEQVGLQPVSAHIAYRSLRENPDGVLRYSSELGLEFVVTEPDTRSISSEGELDGLAAEMDRLGMEAAERGLRLAMHNHSVQFERSIGGKPIYWHLVEKTDPRYVFFQPDVYWVKYAGFDPVAVISSLRGRCPLLHLKDMKDERTREMAEVGQGVIDFEAVISAAEKSGAEWYIVEHDHPPGDSIESARRMLEYLKARFGGSLQQGLRRA